MTRILAVDLGSRRIGIALSDPTGSIALPLETIAHSSRQKDIEAIAALVRTHGAERLVVGWPRNMDGTAGPAARQAETFADALRRTLGIPVELWDERLSTVAANRALRQASVRRARRRDVRDQIAAVVILQAYLSARPWTRGISGLGSRQRTSGDAGRN